MSDDKLTRSIIRDQVKREAGYQRINLTDAAVERATDHGMKLTGQNMNWGQIGKASVEHVKGDVIK